MKSIYFTFLIICNLFVTFANAQEGSHIMNYFNKIAKLCILFILVITFFVELSCDNVNNEINYPISNYIVSDFISEDYYFSELGLNYPIMARINPTGNIVILDSGDDCLYEFSNKGEFIKKIGRTGQGPGDILLPTSFNIDENGDIYVYESGNQRMSIFSNEGKFINSFRIKGAVETAFFITGNNEIVMNLVGSDHYITIFSREGIIINEVGSIIKYSENDFVNNLFMAGFPFVDNKGNYYIIFQHMPLAIIFDNDGNKSREIQLDFPEFDLKDYIPPDKHRGFGQPVLNLYNGIIFKNNYFYIMPQSYSLIENTYYRNIYKVSTSFQIERKINSPPFPSSKSQKRALPIRYRVSYSPFDISDDETSIYYPLRGDSKVVRITCKIN